MINKTILLGLVAISFVAGTIMTGTMTYGAKGGDPIVDALNSITNAIKGINPTVNVNPTPITINAPQGPPGGQGIQGNPGQACWDLNNNGIGDLPVEDTSRDGVVDINDCKGPRGDTGTSSDIADLELRIDTLENIVANINKVPTVNAGVDQTITGVILPGGCFGPACVPESLSCTTTLAGIASDDGLKQPITTTWKHTGVASFDPSDLNTSINFLAPTSTLFGPAQAEFELEVYDGFYTDTDTVKITCNLP